MSKPKISIVIPVYNGVDYLRQAIDSALNQTCPDFEVIVVNDGSNDGGQTDTIARSYGDKIRYLLKHNGGVASALNLGIENMIGEWFAWLSHDDLFSNNRVETDLAVIAQRPDAQVVFCKTRIIDSNGELIRELPCPLERVTNPREALMLGGVNMCSITIHRSCFDTVGLFNQTNRTTQDTEMSLRLSSKFTFYLNPNACTSSRDHPNRGQRVYSEQNKKDILWIAEMIHSEMTLKDFFPHLGDDEREVVAAWRWLGYEYRIRGATRYAQECDRAAMLTRKNPWRRRAGLIEFEIRRLNNPLLNALLFLVERLYTMQGAVRREIRNRFTHRIPQGLVKS